jgi:hypothetical protein
MASEAQPQRAEHDDTLAPCSNSIAVVDASGSKWLRSVHSMLVGPTTTWPDSDGNTNTCGRQSQHHGVWVFETRD